MIEEEALLSRFEEVDILALETSELTENFNDNFISLEGGEIDKLISQLSHTEKDPKGLIYQ